MAGDFNKDGRLDIAIAGRSGPVVWYINPSWRRVEVGAGGWKTVAGVAVDVDGDGDCDIVPGSQVWFENPLPDGDPTAGPWKRHTISEIESHDVFAADLNGDGRMDLVSRDQSGFGHNAGNRIYLHYQQAPNRWWAQAIDCPHGEGLAPADIDRDGDTDIVIGGIWFENPGRSDAAWTQHQYTKAWTWADAKVATGDLSGDGRPDVVVAPAEYQGGSYRLAWYECPADPRAADWPERIIDQPLESVMHSLAVADMDADGRQDVITARMHQGAAPREVCIYLNPGNGGTWRKVVLSEKGSHDILVADLDGDGRPDVMGANHGGPYQPVELWLNREPSDK